jgi:hypothetical protein
MTIALRCDIPVVLVKSQNYTADAWSKNTTIIKKRRSQPGFVTYLLNCPRRNSEKNYRQILRSDANKDHDTQIQLSLFIQLVGSLQVLQISHFTLLSVTQRWFRAPLSPLDILSLTSRHSKDNAMTCHSPVSLPDQIAPPAQHSAQNWTRHKQSSTNPFVRSSATTEEWRPTSSKIFKFVRKYEL